MANNLHISYDLMVPGKNYEGVIAKVKELGGWAKVGLSFWYVNSQFTAAQARDHVKAAMDAGDKLYVVDSTNNSAAWFGLPKDVGDYVLDKWTK